LIHFGDNQREESIEGQLRESEAFADKNSVVGVAGKGRCLRSAALSCVMIFAICFGVAACSISGDNEFTEWREERRRAEDSERSVEKSEPKESGGIADWGNGADWTFEGAGDENSAGEGSGSDAFTGGASYVSVAEFPLAVTKVSVSLGENDNTYVDLSVRNAGGETITGFTFTYIGYDGDGEVRADADDEVFTYDGAIEPGETLDIGGASNGWQLKDHAQEGFLDDYGGDWDVDEGYSGWSDQQNFQDRMIAGVKVSVYSARTADGRNLRLSAESRQWSDKVLLG
jgi:hypothetical protein